MLPVGRVTVEQTGAWPFKDDHLDSEKTKGKSKLYTIAKIAYEKYHTLLRSSQLLSLVLQQHLLYFKINVKSMAQIVLRWGYLSNRGLLSSKTHCSRDWAAIFG